MPMLLSKQLNSSRKRRTNRLRSRLARHIYPPKKNSKRALKDINQNARFEEPPKTKFQVTPYTPRDNHRLSTPAQPRLQPRPNPATATNRSITEFQYRYIHTNALPHSEYLLKNSNSSKGQNRRTTNCISKHKHPIGKTSLTRC